MASLARQLQHAFVEHCPTGWECVPEARVVSAGIEAILGYAPQADVLFREAASGRSIWVELEVSRADPVANHAKFASAHLVEPFPRQDTFLSMVSHHVQNGRRNLAAHTIGVMRALGLRAFQTQLLPKRQITWSFASRLNHGPDRQGPGKRAGQVSAPRPPESGVLQIPRKLFLASKSLRYRSKSLRYRSNLLRHRGNLLGHSPKWLRQRAKLTRQRAKLTRQPSKKLRGRPNLGHSRSFPGHYRRKLLD